MAAHHRYDNDLISLLVETVHRNLGDEKFGASELASAIGMSQRKLSCKIKSLLNKSVSQFIREARLLKAMEMLHNDDITAAEVAFKVGFGSSTYFNKCFHEFFGYPPGKIRKGDIDPSLEFIEASKIFVPRQGKSFLKKTAIFFKIAFIPVVIIITGYYFLSGRITASNSATDSDKQEISLAVLPFKNLADSSANQYFIEGLRDEILTNFSKIHSLRVISLLSDEILHGNNVSASALRKKLHVDYLVTGSGQKSNNSYHLRVQLIDAKKNRQKWADSYTTNIRETNDIFQVQNQIALSIVTNLKAAITPEEKQLIEKTPTLNLKSWDFYQRGMYELAKSPFVKYNDEAIKRGDKFFRLALKYDSTFAEAYIGRAWVFLSRAEINDYDAKYLDSMFILTNIALSYNDKLSDGYYTRGFYFFFSRDPKHAIKEYEKAILYNPNNWYAFQALGFCLDDVVKSLEMEMKAVALNHDNDLPIYLAEVGRIFYGVGFPEKGNFYFREALNLDGDSIRHSDNIIEVEVRTEGDYLKAIQHYKKRYLKDSTDALTLLNLGYYCLLKGYYNESLDYYNKYLLHRATCDDNITYERQLKEPYLGYALLRNGFTKEAGYFFDKLIDENRDKNQSGWWLIDNYTLACMYAVKGDRSMTYKNLEIFSSNTKSYLQMWLTRIKTDPYFDNLRNEPRFKKIVQSMESKYQEDHEKVRKWLEGLGEV